MSSVFPEASLRVYGCQLRDPACFARSFEFGERLFFRRCQLVRLLSISRGIGGGLVVGVAAFVFRLSDHCSYFSFHFGAREARGSVSEGMLANSSGAPGTSTPYLNPHNSGRDLLTGATRLDPQPLCQLTVPLQ
jgi:hypothetical protein